MKIAYVLDWDILGQSSVLNKIQKKITYWESKGHEVCFMIVSYNTNESFVPHIRHIRIFERPELAYMLFSSLKTFFGRNIAFGRLFKELKTFSPDIVYLRPGTMWYPNVSKIVSFFRTVLELNSIDEEEVKLYYPNGDIRYKIFKYGRADLLKKCKGIVSLTDEISAYYASYNKTSIVISNGVNFKKSPVFETNVEEPNIIFVGTPGQVWQGFDQFITMATLLPAFKFHLVGPSLNDLKRNNTIPNNLTCHGFLGSNALEKLYQSCTVGVGTLALFNKSMEEACPLKVREYVSNQLLLILGYKDTDFHEEPFSLYLGNHVSNVQDNIDKIRDFILDSVRLRSVYKELIKDKFTIEYKEDERLVFLKNVRAT